MIEEKNEYTPGDATIQKSQVEMGQDIVNTLNSNLESLRKQLDNLEDEFKSKIKYNQHKEKIIDELHRELQAYKNDLIKSQVRPVIMDIIHVIDNINKLVTHQKARKPIKLDPLKLLGQMEGISSDLEEVLNRQGVEPFKLQQPGFDPKSQRVVKTEFNADPSKDKSVAGVIQGGYEWEGNILRKEQVIVYTYKEKEKNNE